MLYLLLLIYILKIHLIINNPIDNLFRIYFKSSSNSLQLYLVINDVNAAGIIIIGVRDGRFDVSTFDVCNLSILLAIGFGIDVFVVVFKKQKTKK